MVGLSGASPADLHRFVDEAHIPFPLLHDPDGTAMRVLGVYHKTDARGALPRPGSLVFDAAGRLFRRRVVRVLRPAPIRLLADLADAAAALATTPPAAPSART